MKKMEMNVKFGAGSCRGIARDFRCINGVCHLPCKVGTQVLKSISGIGLLGPFFFVSDTLQEKRYEDVYMVF